MRAPSLSLDTRLDHDAETGVSEEAKSPLARDATPPASLIEPYEEIVALPPSSKPKLAIVARNTSSDVKKASWPFKGQERHEMDGPDTAFDRPEQQPQRSRSRRADKAAKDSKELKRLEVKSVALGKSEPKVPAHGAGQELRSELNSASNRQLKKELGTPFDFAGPHEQTADHPPDSPLPPASPIVERKRSGAKSDPARGASALFIWSDGGMKPSVSVPPPPPPPSGPHAESSSEKKQRTPTGVAIPRLPLPPATENGDRPAIRLRRNESVIAEADAEKNGSIWKAEQMARRASTEIAGVFSGGLAAMSLIGEMSARGVKRFESMPRKKQIMWVAAPYAVVILLVLVLIELRQPSSAAATVIPPQPIQIKVPAPVEAPAAPALAVATAPAPAPEPVTAPVVEANAVTKLVGKEVVVPPAPPADEPLVKPAKTVWRTVPIASALRAKADAKAPKVVKLKAGTKLITYPEFPAREGWVLAQKQDGEIGFMKLATFDASPAPAKIAKPKKQGKVDPFRELQRPRKKR